MSINLSWPNVLEAERMPLLPAHSTVARSGMREQGMTRAVADFYRCPTESLNFGQDETLSLEPAFFAFGTDAVGFGQVSDRLHLPSGPALIDLLANVSIAGDKVELPFNPDEVIDNLRLERYAHGGMTLTERMLKHFYYRLRPLTTPGIRNWIKSLRARSWEKVAFPHWPVDTSVENICERLLLLSLRANDLERMPFIWFWPRGARGCVLMTHDVEAQAGHDFCDQLLKIDAAHGIKASFQIVPEKRYKVTPAFLDSIRRSGGEVAVQDLNHDGRLFDDRAEFRRRVAIINRYGREFGATGFRAAALYRKPEWFEDLEFSFDMSIPNVARLDPQRGGCCSVMPYFIGNMLELPLTTVQDYMLFHMLKERSIDLWKAQVGTILDKYGLASFIVHPDYVLEPDTLAVYESLLAWLNELRSQRNLWFALPSQIDSWWRARHRMTIVLEGGCWRIEGEGAEQARLAFAREVDGKLVYELVEDSAVTAPRPN